MLGCTCLVCAHVIILHWYIANSCFIPSLTSLEEIASRIKVHTVETVGGCVHEVAVPPDVEYVPLKPSSGKPAKEYPFVLDSFQNEAIMCIENNQSVLVSAHTSAGKTVTAE